MLSCFSATLPCPCCWHCKTSWPACMPSLQCACIMTHCFIVAQLCAATVSAAMSSEKGACNPALCLCLQAALDKLRELIFQQHHLPPITAVQHLQTATATPEAETATMSSVDQVQHTLAFTRAANLVSSQAFSSSNSGFVSNTCWHQGPMLCSLW